MDTMRMNKVIGAVLARTPEVCKTDEEREAYDRMLRIEEATGFTGWDMVDDDRVGD